MARKHVGSRMAYVVLVSLLVGACNTSSTVLNADDSDFFADCNVCPKLVRIDPGVFRMGTAEHEPVPSEVPETRAILERPAHSVRIDYPFAIGRYEITVGEFAAFAESTGYEASGCFVLTGGSWGRSPTANWRAPGFEVSDAHPATCLSYDDFFAYLQWLNAKTGETYRFPTEAEWEYVARSGLDDDPAPALLEDRACDHLNGADASFGQSFTDDWNPGLFSCTDGHVAASPVGSFRPNKFGMYDMFGNMSEWTEDCSGQNYEGAPTDGSAHHFEPCESRVVKGGSWAGGPGYLRPAIRGAFPVALRGDGHGLRVVREL